MHGMLSAAIILIVFALVAAIGGGSAVWLYRAASVPSGRSRRSSGSSAQPAGTAPESGPDTAVAADVPTVVDAVEIPEIARVAGTHRDDSDPAVALTPVAAAPGPVAEIEDSPRTELPPLRPALPAP